MNTTIAKLVVCLVVIIHVILVARSHLSRASLETTKTVESTEPRLVLPNLLVAGVQKGGTTTISGILSSEHVCAPIKHPDEPDYFEKETHFFDHGTNHSVHDYAWRYAHCANAPFVLDATPNYINQARRIYDFYAQHGDPSQLKVILSLREPVDRELSLYYFMARLAREQPIPDWVEPVVADDGSIKPLEMYLDETLWGHLPYSYGMYGKCLPEWFELFDRQQILVVSFHELEENPAMFLHRIQSFLGLPDFDGDIPVLNGGKKHHALSCALAQRLSQAFQASNEALYALLDQYPGPLMEARPFPRFQEPSCEK